MLAKTSECRLFVCLLCVNTQTWVLRFILIRSTFVCQNVTVMHNFPEWKNVCFFQSVFYSVDFLDILATLTLKSAVLLSAGCLKSGWCSSRAKRLLGLWGLSLHDSRFFRSDCTKIIPLVSISFQLYCVIQIKSIVALLNFNHRQYQKQDGWQTLQCKVIRESNQGKIPSASLGQITLAFGQTKENLKPSHRA